MRKFVQTLLRDERGVTAVEYGILAAIVVGVLVLAGATFGDELTALWGRVTDGMGGAGVAAGEGG